MEECILYFFDGTEYQVFNAFYIYDLKINEAIVFHYDKFNYQEGVLGGGYKVFAADTVKGTFGFGGTYQFSLFAGR
jgi:hypothetical protein